MAAVARVLLDAVGLDLVHRDLVLAHPGAEVDVLEQQCIRGPLLALEPRFAPLGANQPRSGGEMSHQPE